MSLGVTGILGPHRDCFKPELRSGSLPGEEVEGVEPCEKCGSQVVLRRTKKGGYLLCSKLPDCKQKRAIDDDLRKRLYDAGKPLAGDEEFFGSGLGLGNVSEYEVFIFDE